MESEANIGAFKDYAATDEPVAAATTEEPKTPSAPKPKPAQSTPAAMSAPSMTPVGSSRGTGGRLFASPLAKRLAAEQGIDLNMLAGSGSGPSGRIRAQDLKGATIGSSAGFSDVQLSGMRRAIAKRLSESKQTIPHYYLTVDIEINELLR